MNRRTQTGISTLGLILVIGVFGIIVVTGFKILPLYRDFYTIQSIMDSVAGDQSIDPKSRSDLMTAIRKNLLVNQVRFLKKENFKFAREEGVTSITVDYDAVNPYIAQLYIGGHFTYTVEIRR